MRIVKKRAVGSALAAVMAAGAIMAGAGAAQADDAAVDLPVLEATTTAKPRITGGTTRGAALTARVGDWTCHSDLALPGASTVSRSAGLGLLDGLDSGLPLSDLLGGLVDQLGTTLEDLLGGLDGGVGGGQVPTLADLLAQLQIPGLDGSRTPTLDDLVGPSAHDGFTWLRDGKTLATTGSRYVLSTSDAGRTLAVIEDRACELVPGAAPLADLLGQLVWLGTGSSTSSNVKVPAMYTAKPTVSQIKRKVGQKVYSTKGTWYGAGYSYSYQWLRNGKAISGATKSTYTLAKADGGKRVALRVTAKKSGFTSVWATSAQSKVINRR